MREQGRRGDAGASTARHHRVEGSEVVPHSLKEVGSRTTRSSPHLERGPVSSSIGSNILVDEGQKVQTGDIIAKIQSRRRPRPRTSPAVFPASRSSSRRAKPKE